MYRGSTRPRELAVGPSLERVFLQVGAARNAPAEQEQRGRPDQPGIRPCRRKSGVRMRAHAPERENVQPPINDEPAPKQLESQILVDQLEGVQVDSLENEVIEDIKGEEGGVQEHAGVGILAEALVVVNRAGERVDREHRPADTIEVHPYVEAVAEERELPDPPRSTGPGRSSSSSVSAGCRRRRGQGSWPKPFRRPPHRPRSGRTSRAACPSARTPRRPARGRTPGCRSAGTCGAPRSRDR